LGKKYIEGLRMKYLVSLFIMLTCTPVLSHELTPTYPKMRPAYVDGVLVTTMDIWNRRTDVEYYEIEVFNKYWEPLPFASQDKIIKINYLQKKQFNVYIKSEHGSKAVYICTTSKLLREDVLSTGVKSRICSKIK
jgi:hypothetical protein